MAVIPLHPDLMFQTKSVPKMGRAVRINVSDVGLPDIDGREAVLNLAQERFQGADHHAHGQLQRAVASAPRGRSKPRAELGGTALTSAPP
jgi:hypothetical protein